jgi:hypothetical protein
MTDAKTLRFYLAGINSRPLAAVAKGHDVLISFADVKKGPAFWAWLAPMIDAGHFRSVILDSGAFTELSARKRGKTFTIDLVDFADFAVENAHRFTWVANLDSIEGDVDLSNRNLAYLESRGLPVAPVYHEGESLEQLEHCAAQARQGRGVLAIGCQRPKGSLRPRKVVEFLTWLAPQLERLAGDLEVHGFGLTRYASAACPCGSDGFSFASVDSTTWIAEGCALYRSGAIADRHASFRATVDSYHGVAWVDQLEPDVGFHGEPFDIAQALEAGGQAATVARRHQALDQAVAA